MHFSEIPDVQQPHPISRPSGLDSLRNFFFEFKLFRYSKLLHRKMSFILFLGTGQASHQSVFLQFFVQNGTENKPPLIFLLLFMNCSHVLPSLVFLIIFEERFLWSKFFVLNLDYLTIWYERPCIISRKIEIDWQKCLMCL